MATLDFKFAIGDRVYTADELRSGVAYSAKCYTVETVICDESGNKYSLSNTTTGWIPEDKLVAVDRAKSFAIASCASLMQQIAMRDFEK